MFTQDDVAGGRKGAWNKTNRIVVAIDSSRSSCGAIEVAVEWAVEHRAELTFVHVVPRVDVVNGLGLEFPGIATLHEPTELDRELLAEAVRIAAEQGVAATTALLAGTTADAIVAHAEASDADLIVVGSRGHGPVSDALRGSVSHAVLRHARCRVLVVRGAQTS